LQFAVHRVPFFLEPGHNSRGDDFEESHLTRMLRKFGSQENFEAMKRGHRLAERGAEVGISFNEERVVSATLPSHRLVQYVAREHGLTKSEELYAILNQRHFVEGKKLNDFDMLATSCEEIGLIRQTILHYLVSDEDCDEVEAMVEAVHSMGINSIPSFIIASEHLVSGAERSETFVEIFRALEAKVLAGKSLPSKPAIAPMASL